MNKIAGPGELTIRALLVGALIGALLAASNVYVGLKIGLFDAGAITAAIIGVVFLRSSGPAPSSREVNVLVTTSSAAAMVSGASGLLGPLAAMGMLGLDVPAWTIILWSIAVSVLGLLIALPLRTPLVTTPESALAFPTARATVEVIESMTSAHRTGPQRARALFASTGLSAAIAWFRDGRPAILPASIPIPGHIGAHSLESLTVSIAVSPLLLSSGALIGARVGISILIGAITSWIMLVPILVDHALVSSMAFADVVSWLMWPGAALMVSSTLTSLVLQGRSLARGIGELRTMSAGGSKLVATVIVASLATCTIAWLAFDIPPIALLVALILTPMLAAACARATGETDMPPVGPLGGVAQIAIAPLTPGHPISTLAGGAMVNGAATQTSQAMYAFSAGHRLGSSPRVLIAAQLIGIGAGALVVVPVYALLTNAYGLGSDMLPASAPQSWKATAQAVSAGIDAMPTGAPLAALIGALTGIALTIVERTRFVRFVPSPIGIGIAFLIPASYSITLAIGAIGFALAQRRWPRRTDEHGATIAAGGIAGEAVMGIAIALLTVFVFSAP
jgi:uncharacterized oligopeptide transporter (OPT) family protein